MRGPSIAGYFVLSLTTWLWMTPLYAALQADDYAEALKAIVTGFDNRNAEPFNRAIDVKSIADNATEGLLVDPDWKRDFVKGLTIGVKSHIGQRLVDLMAPGSYVKLLRIKPEGDEGRALLRFDYGDKGNSYIDLHLKRTASGHVRIVDWFDYGTGQLYSGSLRQLIAIVAPTPTLLGKLFDVATDRKETADTLRELIRLNKEQRYTELVQKFLAQDESFRRSRLLGLIAVYSANLSGDMDLYYEALTNLERFHGDEEDLFLILLDYYFIEEKYDRVLGGLDRIAKLFGAEDAGLEVYRANANYLLGNLAAALSAAERAVTLEPEYEYGHLSLLMARTALEDYAGAVKTARLLEERFDYDMSPEALAEQEGLAPLVQSEAYRSWRTEH